MTVVKNGKILASLPLKMAGIISTDSFEKVSQNFQDVNSTILDSGCKFQNPHLIPLFLPFLALPAIRILFSGIVDIKTRSYIPPFK
jgi:adenine deaminase